VAAGPVGRFQNHHIVAPLAELPRAAQSGQASARNYHPLGAHRRGHRPWLANVCQERRKFENVTPMHQGHPFIIYQSSTINHVLHSNRGM
jgi:hypothetical protein